MSLTTPPLPHIRPGTGPHPYNPLWQHFIHNTGRTIHKWHHYFDIYHSHFQRYRGKPVTVLEIGCFRGGSLEMWRQYFGPDAVIHGVDIVEESLRFAGKQTTIHIGDQADPVFLKELREKVGKVDILIDDGGHFMHQQIISFQHLFDLVAEDGVYLIEDLHTSYWEDFDGGHLRPGTFIEYSKTLIDALHGWHSREPSLQVDAHTSGIGGLHFYDSVLVVEKMPRIRPVDSLRGMDQDSPPPTPVGTTSTETGAAPPLPESASLSPEVNELTLALQASQDRIRHQQSVIEEMRHAAVREDAQHAELLQLRRQISGGAHQAELLQLRQQNGALTQRNSALAQENRDLARTHASLQAAKARRTEELDRVKAERNTAQKAQKRLQKAIDRWNARPWRLRLFRRLQVPADQ